MQINRRTVLGGAGLAGAAAATGAGIDRLFSDGTSGYRTDKVEPMIDQDAARFGNPRLPSGTITSQSHLSRLGAQPPPCLMGVRFSRRMRTISRY
jgi:oxalate decarboxylase